jgi:hypothetical protein
LVAFCLRHFSADFIIGMCEFDFRQAQLAAYRCLIAAKDDDEYSDARVELFLALGRAPWQYDVLAAGDDEPPAYIKEPWRIEDYKKTREIRRELERAKAMW